jgi:hypothetical protein
MAETRLWHVRLTVAGPPVDAGDVARALTRLAAQHRFLHSLRYAGSCAEVTYWDEALSMLDAAALAIRLWDEHRVSASLPHWEVTGLEILEQSVHASRPDWSPRTAGGSRRDTGGSRLATILRPVPF